ncbi:hypothetical protein QVD17_06163 [Tagetes erecta]|uniref:Uncharacterized protein n=1 Tax=Tagetes erecta TaxID=13708 RepID=A0AAD8LFJ9_TARER|nr:hypothetical protein QVD17_06163 [Tagetes erecta]
MSYIGKYCMIDEMYVNGSIWVRDFVILITWRILTLFSSVFAASATCCFNHITWALFFFFTLVTLQTI